jgi:hypothetical protein
VPRPGIGIAVKRRGFTRLLFSGLCWLLSKWEQFEHKYLGEDSRRRLMTKGKNELRKRLAALTFTEKIRILEKLRYRSQALAASGLRRTSSIERPGSHSRVVTNREG